MNINDCIECPKCQKKFMKKALGKPILGKEYYCHFCHEYFGLNELVNFWEYDAGDLFANSGLVYPQTFAHHKGWYINWSWHDTLLSNEPTWDNITQRQKAYETVDRMFLGIPEWVNGCDNRGIDIGVIGYPI